MNIQQALRELGLNDPLIEPDWEGEDLCLCTLDPAFGMVNIVDLDYKGTADLGPATYIASGVFRPGTLTRVGGRSRQNVARILWLPFDLDLARYAGVEASTLHLLPEPELELLLEQLLHAALAAAAELDLPVHRVVSSGYGLQLLVWVDREDAHHVAEWQAVHKRLVSLMAPVGADPAVSDAGSRVTRLPGSFNRKSEQVRTVRVVFRAGGSTLPIRLAPWRVTTGVTRRDNVGPRPTHEVALAGGESATIVDLIRPHWIPGQRHSVALGLAGALAFAGVPRHEVEAVIEELMAGDPEGVRRNNAVQTTYQRMDLGLSHSGLGSLATLVDDHTHDTLRDLLHGRWDAAAAEPAPERLPAEPRGVDAAATGDLSGIPSDLRVGMVDAYLRLRSGKSEVSPQFHVACILNVASASVGRRVRFQWVDGPQYTNIFTLLVGEAGQSKKDTAINLALRMPGPGPRPFKDLRDLGSAEALVRVLADNENVLLTLSEFSKLTRVMQRDGSQNLSGMVLDAYSGTRLSNTTKGTVKDGLAEVIAEDFTFSLLAGIQPLIAEEEFSKQLVSAGMLSRLQVVPASPQPAVDYPDPPDPYLEALVWNDFVEAVGYVRGAVMEITPAAMQEWAPWYQEVMTRETDELLSSTRSRLPLQAMKTAAIVAASLGVPALDLMSIRAGIGWAEWLWRQAGKVTENWGEATEWRVSQAILELMQDGESRSAGQILEQVRRRGWTISMVTRGVRDLLGVQGLVKDSVVPGHYRLGQARSLPSASGSARGEPASIS